MDSAKVTDIFVPEKDDQNNISEQVNATKPGMNVNVSVHKDENVTESKRIEANFFMNMQDRQDVADNHAWRVQLTVIMLAIYISLILASLVLAGFIVHETGPLIFLVPVGIAMFMWIPIAIVYFNLRK